MWKSEENDGLGGKRADKTCKQHAHKPDYVSHRERTRKARVSIG